MSSLLGTSLTESLYGVVSGSLELLALTGEVFAGSIAARAVPAAATAGTTRLLTMAGWTAMGEGLLGCASAGVDAFQSFGKANGLAREGDSDAALSSFGDTGASALAFMGSGALTIIAAGTFLAQAGASRLRKYLPTESTPKWRDALSA